MKELNSIVDFIRWATSRFNQAALVFGHGCDAALDEASHLVLQALHLPYDLPPAYGQAALTAQEKKLLLDLIERRVAERKPVAYLLGRIWFAGLLFKTDQRALVPRSPIAELIVDGFEPWTDASAVRRALDLCTGSGCIGIAMGVYHPEWQVDIADISDAALALAKENIEFQAMADRVHAIRSDLFEQLEGRTYDLIVSNPPYVPELDVRQLPAEYHHEPALGLAGGHDGLDIALKILRQAPAHLSETGVLIVEVGDSQPALEACLPNVPFTWIEFKEGQMGVFALDRKALLDCQADVARLLEARKLAAPSIQ